MNGPDKIVLTDESVEFGDLNTSIGFLLRLAQVQVFQSIYETLEETGLKLGEYTVLRVIGQNPGVRQGAIARALKIKPAHMTKLVQRMVKADYVERSVPPGDRRSVMLLLTDTGRAFVDSYRDEFKRFDSGEKLGLNTDEVAQLQALLLKLIAAGVNHDKS